MFALFHSLSRARVALAAAAFVGVLSGCQGDAPKVVPVKGVINLDGQPLAGGFIATVPASGRGAKATVQADGTFELGTYASNDGAVPGTHKVAVVAREPSADSSPEAPLGKLLVPVKYTDPVTSQLTIEVKASGDNHPVLELSSK